MSRLNQGLLNADDLFGVYIQNVRQEMGDQNMGICGYPGSILNEILWGMSYKTYHKSIKSISKSLGCNEKKIPREFYYNFVFNFSNELISSKLERTAKYQFWTVMDQSGGSWNQKTNASFWGIHFESCSERSIQFTRRATRIFSE